MKIYTNNQYQALAMTFHNMKVENEKLKDQIAYLEKKIKVLENDKNILLNIINPDIAAVDFPNGSNEKEGGDNLSIWEM